MLTQGSFQLPQKHKGDFLEHPVWSSENTSIVPAPGVGNLVISMFKFTKSLGKFNSNLNDAGTAYICKHSVCLHTPNMLTMFQRLHLLVNSE